MRANRTNGTDEIKIKNEDVNTPEVAIIMVPRDIVVSNSKGLSTRTMMVPLQVCQSKTTAIRLAKEHFQLTTYTIEVVKTCYNACRSLCLPIFHIPIAQSTAEDIEIDRNKKLKESAFEKLEKAGLTKEEIGALLTNAMYGSFEGKEHFETLQG
jgi:hypothetical protein